MHRPRIHSIFRSERNSSVLPSVFVCHRGQPQGGEKVLRGGEIVEGCAKTVRNVYRLGFAEEDKLAGNERERERDIC